MAEHASIPPGDVERGQGDALRPSWKSGVEQVGAARHATAHGVLHILIVGCHLPSGELLQHLRAGTLLSRRGPVKSVTRAPRRSISPRKSQAWHRNIHHYFTKQPANVVAEYIAHFTDPGDLVLDPFVGSGVTTVEAVAQGRRSVGIDLSPFACLVARETLRGPISVDRLLETLQDIAESPFSTVTTGEYLDSIFHLGDRARAKLDIPYWFPANVKCPPDSDFDYVHEMFDRAQLVAYSVLLERITEIRDEAIRGQFLLALSATMARANLTYNLSTTRGVDRLGDGGAAIFAQYRYWKPTKFVVLNVWDRFTWRVREIARAKRQWNHILAGRDAFQFGEIRQGSATDLAIDRESVDYIFTDPPYGAHIAYLDLATMWNAWFKLDVSSEARELEVIEGGALNKQPADYDRLLAESVKEMARVLAYEGWVSLVFAHKDIRYWNSVVNAFASAGLAYRSTAVQRTNQSSIHFKKNPLRVLSNQLIISFEKSAAPAKIKQVKRSLDEAVVAAAERVILREDGASTDEIYESVIPELIEAGLLHEATQKLKTLIPVLGENFDLDERTNTWHIKKGAQISTWIPRRDRVRHLIRSALNERRLASLDELHAQVFPDLANGLTPTVDEFSEVLEEIAHSPDGRRWQLRPGVIFAEQPPLGLDTGDSRLPRVPPGTMGHNEAIYRLAQLGHAGGFDVWVGTREKHDEFAGEELRVLSMPEFPIELTSAGDRSRIPWIDVLWFHRGVPVAAFEVEESTGMRDALERFSRALLKFPGLGGFCYLVVPDARSRKLNLELTESSYIGHPMYMETKVRFMLYSGLVSLYEELVRTGAPASLKLMSKYSRPAYRASLRSIAEARRPQGRLKI